MKPSTLDALEVVFKTAFVLVVWALNFAVAVAAVVVGIWFSKVWGIL